MFYIVFAALKERNKGLVHAMLSFPHRYCNDAYVKLLIRRHGSLKTFLEISYYTVEN